MTSTKSISKLMASMANLFWDTLSNEQVENIFNFSSFAIKEIPFKELQFQKNTEFWQYVES